MIGDWEELQWSHHCHRFFFCNTIIKYIRVKLMVLVMLRVGVFVGAGPGKLVDTIVFDSDLAST